MNRFDPDYFPQGRDVRRLGYVPHQGQADWLASQSPATGIKCHGGVFGFGDKLQTDVTNQTGSSEDSQLAQNGQNAKDSAVSQGGFLTTNIGPGAINAASGANVTLTDGGAFDLARDFVTNYNATLTDLVSAQNDSLAEASSTTSGLIAGLADKISALVESRNTDGESTRNNTILYIALAVAAVFGLFVWRRTR